ncbi:MAG: IS701 family transposase [Candidatus Accumulibacter sp.]|nr:IS701 family transposase [Accumulibacter sp.]MCM8661894.1 IS701 family transposase [Accumulibacter sp.]
MRYLRGLYQARRRNLERMADVVAGSDYQRMHHMLSASDWEHAGVVRQVAVEAQAHFPRGGRALIIDESGFAKKGECSAGVARQWNGRMGKVDNCQIGVFAALAHGETACLIDAELFLPKAWVAHSERCIEAGIPEEARIYRSKAEIALGLIRRARRNGLSFDWVAADGGYGHLPWFLTELDDDGERFLIEVHSDQRVYLQDPAPTVLQRHGKGRAPTRPVTEVPSEIVTAWATAQPPGAWRRMKLRDGEKGEVVADFLTRRLFVWDGKAMRASHWHLLVRREMGGDKLKFCLSNAKPSASLRQLVTMQASRHFVERAFEDAKSACGMADYQVRGWLAWHHHMALVLVAHLFLAKERLALRDSHRFLSCLDIVAMLRHKLPPKIGSDDDLVHSIAQRHRRRFQATKQRYEQQGITPPASFGALI